MPRIARDSAYELEKIDELAPITGDSGLDKGIIAGPLRRFWTRELAGPG